MRHPAVVSAREARWLALHAQGPGRSRPGRPSGLAALRRAIGAVGIVQLDAINVVQRTQFLVLFSRAGSYDPAMLHTMTGPGSELFEYWGRAASLLPVAHYPLYRWRMDEHRAPDHTRPPVARREAWRAANAAYIAAILAEVRDRGPLTAAQLTDPRRQVGEWWERRSVGRLALEWLFDRGELAAWRTPSFERVYDVPERVIPAAVLAAPVPTSDDAHRTLVGMAARSLGVATVRDLAAYHGLKVAAVRPRVAELVEAGELMTADVEGWSAPAYLPTSARPRPPGRPDATLLSPFDSLIWDRERTRRLFAFEYRIEVYVPAPDRRYGYYVLPLLVGDRLAGRLDLKADRRQATLRVHSAHVEVGFGAAEVAEAAAGELDRLRDWLDLERTSVARRGNLAGALGRVVHRTAAPSVPSSSTAPTRRGRPLR